MSARLEALGVSRTFAAAAGPVHAVRSVDLAVHPGELLVVRGRSGSGKTTLLDLLGGLDAPDAGTVRLDGDLLSAMPERMLVEVRRRRIGYVFQSFGLLPVLSAAENVGVPLRLLRTPVAEREERVAAALAEVGLSDHVNQRPGEMSGGQQQRVSLARALVAGPDVLVADEPTGQLDSATGRQVMELVRSLVASRGLAAVVATHDPVLVSLADTVVELQDGAVTSRTEAPARRGRHSA